MNPGGWLKSVRSFRELCAQIPRGAWVLEVGSGDKPFWRSDVLCDKHWCDNTERGGSLVVDRPAVIGAIEELPFRTQAFDFVICHHLLEHVEDPAVCLEELMRVARRGSIRVPTTLAEKLLSPVATRVLALEFAVLFTSVQLPEQLLEERLQLAHLYSFIVLIFP
jgi:SAM-dependent methyltransferase